MDFRAIFSAIQLCSMTKESRGFMTRESRKSSTEGSPEIGDKDREERYRSRDADPVADRGSATVYATAIEEARIRAIVMATEETSPVTETELEPLFKESIINKNRKVAEAILGATIGFTTASTAAVLMGFGKELAVGSFALAGGYAAWKLKWQSLSGVDWFARKMDGWADKLIDKKLPILNWVVNPLVSLLNKSAKAMGLDKSLAEHLKKKNEDRRKVAEKILKDFREEEKKQEKKEDDATKKKNRQKKLKDILGEDVAAALEGEMEDIESKETPAPVPAPAVEVPKAT